MFNGIYSGVGYNPQMQIPYQTQYNTLRQDFSPKQEIIRVNGENGAKAFNLPPNSSILLLDESQPIIWVKMTDGAGYPTIKAYNITPTETQSQTDVLNLEARIKKLEDIINEQSNNANAKQKSKNNEQLVSKCGND